MNYQSVLVLHVIQDSMESLKSALLLANSWGAHIDICALSTPAATKNMARIDGPGDGAGAREDLAATDARLLEIRQFTDEHQIAVGLANHYTIEEDINEILNKSALYADLVVMSHGTSVLSGVHKKCLDAVLLQAKKPLLLTVNRALLGTDKSEKATELEHIAIAWHEDVNSLKAIRSALPFLKLAKKIDLVLIENQGTGADEERRGGAGAGVGVGVGVSAIETYLARHSINVNVTVAPTQGSFVSHALLDMISQLNPDLVVMGAFGQPAFVEKYFHGVTYDVLASLVHTDLLLSHE